MPTEHGSIDAVAVSYKDANRFNSAYSFLLNIIVLQVWTLIILAGVFFSLRVKKPTRNNTMIMAGIWNTYSPAGILKLTATYFVKLKSWELLLWMLMATIILVGGYALPIQLAPYIIIGHAAPVAPTAIYVSNLSDSETRPQSAEIYALEVPAALRAVAALQSIKSNLGSLVSVDELGTLKSLNGEERVIRLRYGYNVSGLDFGLQHYPDLFLHVEGSCTTEFDWLKVSSEVNSTGEWADVYSLWNDAGNNQTVFSKSDGRRPLVYFRTPNQYSLSSTNTSFAAVISSISRWSFSPSTDPWYRTGLATMQQNDIVYQVMQGRPALSCWQNDIWSYRGQNSSIDRLSELPGLHMSTELSSVISRLLSVPKIIDLATNLGSTALQSSSTALGPYLDAGSASIRSDLERLVLASYIATKDIFTDTTMSTGSIPNMVRDENGSIFPGVAEFVVRSNEVSALSIRALIVVPTISVVLFLIVFLIKNLESPWYKLHALQATVLYSCLDETTTAAHEKKMWQRDSSTVFWEGDAEQACVEPKYGWKGDRKLLWRINERSEKPG